MDLKAHIRNIPDFPRQGIVFRDITTLLKNPSAFRAALDGMQDFLRDRAVQAIAGIESRGFILGAALADRLGTGFVPLRKPGKLPGATLSLSYDLEYGTDALELHSDAFGEGDRVALVDDLLATGGTASAAVQLLRMARAHVVGLALLVELADLNGRRRLDGIEVWSLLKYSGG
ncbi:MAG: adenine phosphoribosyltransferase [Acidobacteriota bacterium]